MHSSALINLDQFFSTYFKKFENPKILDFGSQSLADHKSAKTILLQLLPSDLTSTLCMNQNQYPPTHVIIAPICHIIG